MKVSRWNSILLLSAIVAVLGNTILRAQGDDTVYDQQVRLRSFVDLEYPGVAKAARVQGIVVVRLSLGAAGDVLSVYALSGSKLLIDAVEPSVKRWTFQPGSAKTAIVVYHFALDEGACNDNSRSYFQLIYTNFVSIRACTPVLR